jgi:hypothetical protein
VDPVPDPLLLKKNLVAPGVEPETSGTLTTRPQGGLYMSQLFHENLTLPETWLFHILPT